MKLNLGKVTLNKIILYLSIVFFLVLALQYAMAYFNIKNCNNIETFKKKFRKPFKKASKQIQQHTKRPSIPVPSVTKVTLPKITLPKPPLTVRKSELDACKNQLINKDKIINELQEENLIQKDEINNKNQVIDSRNKEIDSLNYEVSLVQGIGAATQESFAPYY